MVRVFAPYRIFGPVLRGRTALGLPAFLSRASTVNRMKALNLIGASIVKQNGRVAEMSKHFPEIWATYLSLKATAKFLNVTFALWKDLQGIRNQTKPGFHPLQRWKQGMTTKVLHIFNFHFSQSFQASNMNFKHFCELCFPDVVLAVINYLWIQILNNYWD